MTIVAKPVFTVTIEHCPTSEEDAGRCTGRATVCAYLHLEGTIEALVSVGGAPPTKQAQTWTAKILPQKVTFYFKVDNGRQVHRCRDPFGEVNGVSPREFKDGPGLPMKYARSGLPSGKAEDKDDCLACRATFHWVSGAVLAGVDTQGTVTAGVPGASVNVGGGANVSAGAGGPSYPLEVSFTVCCQQRQCNERTDNSAGRVDDASKVFVAGGE